MSILTNHDRNVEPVWITRLSELLLSGVGPGQAVAECGADGVSDEIVRREAEMLMADPLFKQALARTVRLRCREWMSRVYASLAADEGSIVLEDRQDLAREEFLRAYYYRNRAVRLSGLAAGWPAVARWGRTYLREICGEAEVEVMMGRDAAPISSQNTSPRLSCSMRFSEYVDLVYSSGPSNDYYLVSRNRFFDHPETGRLLDDVVCPPYVRLDDPGEAVRMWFGPAGTRTPLHYDDVNQLMVQVVGRKRLRLYAPYFSEAMAQRIRWYAGVDPATADPSQHPLASFAIPLTCELQPGDALFLPVGWWHAVDADEISITLTFRDFGVLNTFA